MRTLFALIFVATPLTAAYSHLVATAAGDAVYFQAATSPIAASGYVARASTTGISVEPVPHPLDDVSANASVQAWSTWFPRYCAFAGSTCWVADSCRASLGIDGPAFTSGNSGNQTLVRLDATGAFAWIEQRTCRGIAIPNTFPLFGLYDAATLSPIFPSGSHSLANQRYGRRLVTPDRRVLVHTGPQLLWLDASGDHPIRNVNGAWEAVTDATGANIVYSESDGGELHWLTGPDWLAARDQDLHLQGSAPALTPDGTALLFLAPTGELKLYDRATGALRTLTAATYSDFTAVNGAAFAVSSAGSLVRIDLATGNSATWLAPFPDIRSVDATPRAGFVHTCDFICYTPQDWGVFLNSGMLVLLQGDSLGQPGWRARSEGVEAPLFPISDPEAWFLVPDGLPRTGETQSLEIYNPSHPLRYTMQIALQDGIPVCLGIAHQDFSRAVTPTDPPQPPEAIHVFLTGLAGAATPPPLADPASFAVLFFGPAPGLAGMQQLDLQAFGEATSIFATPYAHNCAWQQ